MNAEQFAFWSSFADILVWVAGAFVLFCVAIFAYSLYKTRRSSKHRSKDGS